jgi:hypothetical protein
VLLGHNASVSSEDASPIGGRVKSYYRRAADLNADCQHRIHRDEMAEGLRVDLRINLTGVSNNLTPNFIKGKFRRLNIGIPKNYNPGTNIHAPYPSMSAQTMSAKHLYFL